MRLAKPAIKDLRGACAFGVLSMNEGSTTSPTLFSTQGDYGIAAVGDAPTRWKLLQDGKIDAALQPFPLSYESDAAGFSNLGPIAAYVPDYEFTVVFGDAAWAKTNASLVTSYLRALRRGQAFMRSNPDETTAIAARELRTSPALAARALADTARIGIIPEGLSVSEKGLARVFSTLQRAGLVAASEPGFRSRRRCAMTRWIKLFAAFVWFLASIGMAPAQGAFPSRPVHLLVPFAPGGAVDIVARTLGEELSKRWGQAVVVENRPGAGGVVASEAAAKAAPDGYTLIIVATGHALNPYLYAKLPYDTFNDFTPLSLIGTSPNMLLVRADSPFKTLADLIAAARARPGQISYGHAGNGTSPHLAGELLKYMAKIDITPIPYKGGAPALADLIGGHIPMTFNNIPESIAQVTAGTLRPLGVTTAVRSPVLPDVPTIAESGLPGYDTGVWWGMLGPGGLPADLKAKIAKDCAEVVNTPTVKERLLALGATPIGGSPEVFAALIRSDYEKWGPIIQAAGIRAE